MNKEWEIVGYEITPGTLVDDIDYSYDNCKCLTNCPKEAVPIFFMETMKDEDFKNVNLYVVRRIRSSGGTP